MIAKDKNVRIFHTIITKKKSRERVEEMYLYNFVLPKNLAIVSNGFKFQ